jgi:stage II sporulation protein GA (sporulation sigma-E factor processing peptidase)
MLALWSFCAPFGMIYSNGAAYFDIPLSAIAVLTAVAYAIVRAVRYFADKRRKCSRILAVEISRGGRTAALNGLCDTGNSLRDVFSGKPVIVCGRESISAIVPENVSGYLDGNLPEGVRLIPCRTVADNALIPVFAADSVKVDGRRADAVIGVTDSSLGESVDCIFSPDIISM